MNRSWLSDSKVLLDAGAYPRDPLLMGIEQYQVHLVRIDESRNMARFYQLSVEPSLFGDYSVVRNWGRLGTRGRSRTALFCDQKSALLHFLDITKEKKSRGYIPRII